MELFEITLRVYYEDTDTGGVVYHPNYLKYMDRCRCQWLEGLGFNVAAMHAEQNIMFVVRDVSLVFDAPARLFDQLRVTVRPLHVGKVQMQVEQTIYNQDKILCRGQIKLATLNATSFKLTAMPELLRSKVEQAIVVDGLN